ncbi:MAG TPA: permease [Actinomycetota bacterium]|nr:permease [Actinomycetota bacterium]
MPSGATGTSVRPLIAAGFAAAIAEALSFAFGMTWEILWALILGFALSAVVQSVVSKESITRLLPDDSPRSIAVACGLGAASSSCSYAAVALARSLFRKGANFTAAIAFEFASTNLVIELGIVLWLLMGWQFAVAEFVGGPIMIAILTLLFRSTLRPHLIEAARVQANRGLVGSMEGHAEMDMSVSGGSILSRILSPRGFTAISHSFAMDWAAIWKDIVGGLLIAGALAAWVPGSFWQGFFLVDHPVLAAVWGPLVGPLVAMLSFVCSIGNVPLAAVLWNGGISFGGVAAFIYADLIVLPILNIYRKYYGGRVTMYLLVTFYAAMVAAGLIVELLFGALGLIPDERNARVVQAGVTWDYTTVLDIVFLVLAAVLVIRFVRTGGPAMLRMMDRLPTASSDGGPHAEHAHAEHGHAEHDDRDIHTREATPQGGVDEGAAYGCPMHPEVRSSEPGTCPKCGMALVPVDRSSAP